MPYIPMTSKATISRRRRVEQTDRPRDQVVPITVGTDVPCHAQERTVQIERAEGGFAIETQLVARFHGTQDVLVNDQVTIDGSAYRVLAAPKQGPFRVVTMQRAA